MQRSRVSILAPSTIFAEHDRTDDRIAPTTSVPRTHHRQPHRTDHRHPVRTDRRLSARTDERSDRTDRR
jgi:hypothetical protein